MEFAFNVDETREEMRRATGDIWSNLNQMRDIVSSEFRLKKLFYKNLCN